MCGVISLDLVRINDAVDRFKISSRTLRYYEEMGLFKRDTIMEDIRRMMEVIR